MDIVLERPDGGIVGVEVKASATVTAKDMSGLRHLSQVAGDRFLSGVVVYTGLHALRLTHPGASLHAIPLGMLLQPPEDALANQLPLGLS